MIHYDSLQHVSLAITDIVKSRQFYSEILGLREIERPNFDFPGAWYAIGEQQLHLIVHPFAQALRPNATIDSRDGHFAVRIQDYNQALQHLREKNMAFSERPSNKTEWAQIFLCDPDGNVIELNAPRNP